MANISVTLYTDAACTQSATTQQVIDAFSAGDVRILQTIKGSEVVMTALSLAYKTVDGYGLTAKLLVADPFKNALKILNLNG